MSKPIISKHIFSFPFKWQKWDTDWSAPLKELHKIDVFEKLTSEHWERQQFQINTALNYNEYNYFHDYARDALYDMAPALETYRNKNSDLMRCYVYKNEKINTFQLVELLSAHMIETGEVAKRVFHLKIDIIKLKVYRTGTAILSFHLENTAYKALNDILYINKFGRKLGVSFLAPTNSNGETSFSDVPERISIGKLTENEFKEAYTENFKNPLEIVGGEDSMEDSEIEKMTINEPFYLPEHISKLFPTNFLFYQEAEGLVKGKNYVKDKSKYAIYIRPIIDDRMFVTTWYQNNELIYKLKKHKKDYSYKTNNKWYKYVFIDTDTIQTDKNEIVKQLENSSYTRWLEYNTIYGVTRYSFGCLLSEDAPPYIKVHVETLYYNMVELCLLQRATVLSYSDEVVQVSNLIDSNDKNIEAINAKIESLYKHYIYFVNKIYFREITAQEQGIELYDMLQKNMRLSADIKDLDSEIDELNRFSSMQAQNIKAEESIKLTKLATLFLVPTLIAGILGINTMPTNLPEHLLTSEPFWPFWVSILLLIIFSFISVKYIIPRVLKKSNHQKLKHE